MYSKLKKSIAVLLTLVMILGMLPLTALAAEGDLPPLPDPPICRVDGLSYSNLQSAINAASNGATISMLPAAGNVNHIPNGLYVSGKSVTVDTGTIGLYIGQADFSNAYGVLAESGGSINFIGQTSLIVMGKSGLIAHGGGKISVRQKPFDVQAGQNSTVYSKAGGDGIFASGADSVVYLDGIVTATKTGTLDGDIPGSEYAIRAESGARVDVTGTAFSEGWGISASGAGTVVNARQAAGGDQIGYGGILAQNGAHVKVNFAEGNTGVRVEEVLNPNSLSRPLDAYTKVEVTDGLTGSALGVFNVGGVVIVGNKFNTPDGYITTGAQSILGTRLETYLPLDAKEKAPEQYNGLYSDYDWFYFNGAGVQHSFTLINREQGVCAIGSQRYATFKAAFDAVQTGQTIKMLRNGVHLDILTLADGRQFTIDLNGRKLEVKTQNGAALTVSNNSRIHVEGKGEFNCLGTTAGVEAKSGGQVTVTNAEASGGNGAYIGEEGGDARITVLHDAKGSESGAKAESKGLIHVGSYDYAGDAVGETQAGAWAEGGGAVVVFGDAKGKDYGAYVNGGNKPIFEEFNSQVGTYMVYDNFKVGEGAQVLVGHDAIATGADGIGARAEKGGDITVTNDAVGTLAGASVVEQGSMVDQNTVFHGVPETSLPTIRVCGDAVVTGGGGAAVANCHGIVVVDGAMETSGGGGQDCLRRSDGVPILDENDPSYQYIAGYDAFDPSNIRKTDVLNVGHYGAVSKIRDDLSYKQMAEQNLIYYPYISALFGKLNMEFDNYYWDFGFLRIAEDDETNKEFSVASHSYTVAKNQIGAQPKEEDYVCEVTFVGKFTSFKKAMEAIEGDRKTDADGVPGKRKQLLYNMRLLQDIEYTDGLGLYDVKLGVDTNGHNLTLGSMEASVGLYLDNAALTATGEGEVRAIGIFAGVKLVNKSSAEITSAVCDKGTAAFLSGALGAHVAGGSTLKLKKDADGADYGVYAEGKGSEATVGGDAKAESQDSSGAAADGGAKVTVEGKAEGKKFGARATDGGEVTVKGNAKGGSGAGAAAFGEGSKVSVEGDAVGDGFFSNGAYADDKGKVSVGLSATAADGEAGATAAGGGSVTVGVNAVGGEMGAAADGGNSSVTVGGLAVGVNAGSVGAAASGGAKVTVKSGAQGFSCGALASGVRTITEGSTDLVPSSVNISGGTAIGTGPGSCGAQASGGGTVSVSMDAEGEQIGAAAIGVGSKATVKGSAKSTGTAGAYAAEGGAVAVSEDAVGGSFGAYAVNAGSKITVGGSAYALNTAGGYGIRSDKGAEITVKNITGGQIGAVAVSGGKATVDGEIKSCVYSIALGNENQIFYRRVADSVTPTGYLTYSDDVSTVWVKETAEGGGGSGNFCRLPDATKNNHYSAHILRDGGYGTVTWAASSLPSGLLINTATGMIRGTPQADGEFNFTITAQDSLGVVREYEVSMTIWPEGNGARVVSGVLMPGRVGEVYGDVMVADYGTPPYGFSVSGLPPGMEWDNGHAGGQVTYGSNAVFCGPTGIPMRMGIYNVTVLLENVRTNICLIIKAAGTTDAENCDADADSLVWSSGSGNAANSSSGSSASAAAFSAFGAGDAAPVAAGVEPENSGGGIPTLRVEITPISLPVEIGGGFDALSEEGISGGGAGSIASGFDAGLGGIAGVPAIDALTADAGYGGLDALYADNAAAVGDNGGNFIAEDGKIVIGGNNASPDAVKYDLNLPTMGGNGSTIKWSSTNPAIDTDGTVTRPPYSGTNATGILTATVTNGAAVRTVQFTVTVLKLPESSTKPVCEIDGAEYISIFQALMAIQEGESKTIKLLQDITIGEDVIKVTSSRGCSLLIWKRNVTIDLNGFDFKIDRYYLPETPYYQDSYCQSYRDYFANNASYKNFRDYYTGELAREFPNGYKEPDNIPAAGVMVVCGNLFLTGSGEFNIDYHHNNSTLLQPEYFGIPDRYGIFVWDGEATVTNVTGGHGGGYVAGAGSRLTVLGDAAYGMGITSSSYLVGDKNKERFEKWVADKNWSIYADCAEAIVHGNTESVCASGAGSRVQVDGESWGRVEGRLGAQIAINGRSRYITAKDSGTVVTVGGDVWGTIECLGSEVFVKGDCVGYDNFNVGGSGYGYNGLYGVIITGGEVTIDGKLSAGDGFMSNSSSWGYICIHDEEKNRDQITLPSTKEGYVTYTNTMGLPGTVWVKEAAPYFKIGDKLYNTWEEAYNDVPDDPNGKAPPTVVTLLREYDRKLGIQYKDKNILLNLNGYDFTIDTTQKLADADPYGRTALYMWGGKLNLTGEGELNIKALGTGIGVYNNGGKAPIEVMVDNVEIYAETAARTAIQAGDATMTVRGNVTARGKDAVGVSGNGNLTVYGNIIAEACGLQYNLFGKKCSAVVYGDIIVNGNTTFNNALKTFNRYGFSGVLASNGYDTSTAPFVTVLGDVRVYKAAGAAPGQECAGVVAELGAVAIGGSVISDGLGVAASPDYADHPAWVTVDGSITAADAPYIRVGAVDKTAGDKEPVSSKPGYSEYGGGANGVWVGNGAFVPVSDISGLPNIAAAGTPLTLSGMVQPANASRQLIAWSVKDAGATGAVVTNGILYTGAAGTAIVTATVKRGLASGADYVKDFTVTVNGSAFVPVSGIVDVPDAAATGVPLHLTSAVNPADATNKTIRWSVKDAGKTMASIIDGNALYAINPGTAVITASIKNGLATGMDYQQDFTVTVTDNPKIVCEIVGVEKFTSFDNALGTVKSGQTIRLLTNIKQRKPVWIMGKTVNLDLGDYNLELDITGTDYPYALEVWGGGKLFLTGAGTGEFNVTGVNGIFVHDTGSEAMVNNIKAVSAGVCFADTAKKITINGNITVNREDVGGSGIIATPVWQEEASRKELEITVNGSITADRCCIDTIADDYAPKSITVSGDLTCTGVNEYYYVGATGSGRKVSLGLWGGPAINTHCDTVIGGSVISSVKGVSVYGGAKVKIDGNVRAGYNSITSCGETSYGYDPGSPYPVTRVDAAPEIWVGGSVSSSSYTYPGIQLDHGTLQIEGSMGLAGDKYYLSLGGKTFEKNEVTPTLPTTKEGYTTYSYYREDHNHTATIWVGNLVNNPVIDITNLPSRAIVSVPLTLSGTVWPPDAINQTITWSVKDAGLTGAEINGSIFTAAAAGPAIVTATIADGVKTGVPFTKNFTIDVREFAYICEIVETGVQYPDVQMAIDAIGYGESKTIRILQDIVHEDGVEVVSKTVTFDLNGFDLEIKTDDYTALTVRPVDWWVEPDFAEYYGNLYLKGKGEFNITGDWRGIYQIGGEVTVSNVTAAGNAVEFDSGWSSTTGKLTVTGNIITSAGSYAIWAGGSFDSAVNVVGDVTGTVKGGPAPITITGDVNGQVTVDTGRVNIGGDVSFRYIEGVADGVAVTALNGGSVTVAGRINAYDGTTAIDAQGRNSTVTAGGVVLRAAQNLIGAAGIYAYNRGVVRILGDCLIEGVKPGMYAVTMGIQSLERAQVTIDGVYATDTDVYIDAGYLYDDEGGRKFFGPDDFVTPTTKAGYLTYTIPGDTSAGTVWLNATPPPPVTLTGLSVTALPEKAEYTEGENLDLTGIVVKATYSNGTIRDVTALVTTDPSNGALLDRLGAQPVLVSYSEGGVTKTTGFAVTVNEPVVLAGIKVVVPPRKLTYFQGEPLALTGMVVVATMSDGSEFEATRFCGTAPAERDRLTALGTVPVTVGFTAGGVTKTDTFSVEVMSPVALESIAVTTLPYRLSYWPGYKLDLNGMVVRATYSDGSVKTVTGYTTSPVVGDVLNTLGEQPVGVSYTEGGVTKTATFNVDVSAAPVNLDSIAVMTPPNKVAYTQGEALDLTGMVVTARYSDGSTKDVTAVATTAPAAGAVLNTAGKRSVTVSYTENDITRTAMFTVDVNARVTLDNIAVTTPPDKVTYTVGDGLELAGLEVTARYSDGSRRIVTGYGISLTEGAVLNTVGVNSVVVTYSENGVTKTALFTVTVNAKVVLEMIAVTTSPDKTYYGTGETLDLTGMVVTARYSNGSRKAVTGYTTGPADGTELDKVGLQSIGVSYTEDGVTKDARLSVTVGMPPPVELLFIRVEQLPDKLVYTQGEGLDLTGMIVNAYYSDLSVRDVTSVAATAPDDGGALNTLGAQTVTVSYTEDAGTEYAVTKTAAFGVAVIEPGAVILERIAVTAPPDKMTYNVGDALDLTGMVVTAYYSDGSDKDVASGVITAPAQGAALNTAGTQTVEVSYTEDGITKAVSFAVTVNALVVLERIDVHTLPTKTTYTEGELLDLTGMVVKALYSNGDISDVTALVTTDPADGAALNTAGTQIVEVSYTEDGITKTAVFTVAVNAVSVVLDGIAVTTNPDKTAYTVGETLDLTGMIVTAAYSDGSNKAVTGYITNPADGAALNTLGAQTVEVSYTEDGVTKTTSLTVTVNAVPVVLDSIAVTTSPVKITYTEGENLDLTGLVVKATYSDGNIADVTAFVTTVPAGGSSLDTTGQVIVAVSYTEDGITKTTMFPVTVNAKVVLDSIAVTTYPDQIVYNQGDSLDLTGMVVTAAYSDGNTKDVTVKVVTDPADGAALNTAGQQTVEVTYTEDGITKTTSFSVSVDIIPIVPVLDNIAVTTYPDKTNYIVGENLELTGMVVTAYYSDGSSKPATATGFTTDPTDGAGLNTAGSQTVIISYTEDGITKTTDFTVTVNAVPVILDSIAVTTGPYKTAYTAGEKLDLTGVIVTAYYSDGSTRTVAGYATSPADGAVLNTVGAQIIGVSYTESGITKTAGITVTVNAKPVTLVSIAVTTRPDKTAYTKGEPLDLTGMVVTATYSNVSTAVVTGYITAPANGAVLNIAGAQAVDVSYTEGGVTKTTGFTVTVTTTSYAISLDKAAYTFPSATEGYGALTPLTVTVSNTGNQPTGELLVSLSGASAGSFTVSPAVLGSINPLARGIASFDVAPKTGLAAGKYTATVTVSGGNGISAGFNVSFTVNSSGGGSNPVENNPGETASAATPPVTDITPGDTPLAEFNPEHIRYIYGYPNDKFNPDSPITRTEMCVILFRLLTDEHKNDPMESRFPDVKKSVWYYQEVTYLAGKSIVSGYPDGTFGPEAKITRAEFVTMLARFNNLTSKGSAAFPDVVGHWAENSIIIAAEQGWVTGYPDGTFRPENSLTRAEAVTLINRMLGRGIDKKDLPDWAPSYKDLPGTHWAYADIMEASVGHEYERKDNGTEIWTKQLPDPTGATAQTVPAMDTAAYIEDRRKNAFARFMDDGEPGREPDFV